jgi:pimeloyl-ACP methyl ester carboxylesterase
MLNSIALTLALLAPGLQVQQAGALNWAPCPNTKIGMTCADLQVPVDWSKPDGRKTTLKLGRLKATGAAEGSVLVSYGGPGAPGIGFTESQPGPWAGLRTHMNLITWDTRGYGKQFGGLTAGLPCTWTRVPLPDLPATDADFGRLSDTNRGYAEACRPNDPELFANMSSADSARDMEAIRKALGEGPLNFYGASYSGIMGQEYARLFPDQVRTMVLDGTLNHSAVDWAGEQVEMAKGSQQSIERFFTWCRAHDCGEVPRLWRALVARADRKPIPTEVADVAYTGHDLQSFALGLAKQGPAAWPALAQAIRKSARGDASDFVPTRGARYPDQSTGVTECVDWPRPAARAELRPLISRLHKAAPDMGITGTPVAATLGCVGWPAPVTDPPAPLPKGLPPLLGAGAWVESDAIQRVLDQVPGSAKIVHDGPGHTLYYANACARDHIDHYLTDRVLPPTKTTC